MSNTTEAVEIAKKVVDLLAKGAEHVGQTAEQAFPYVVRYEWAQAVTGVGVGVALISLAIAAACGFRYSHKKRESKPRNERSDGEVLFLWGAAAVIGGVVGFVLVGVNMPTVIEPTGSTIMAILRTVTK